MRRQPAVALLLMLAWPLGVAAQEDAAERMARERSRIAAERAEAESRFATDEAACYRKFAVNHCLDEARAKRRTVLSDLRRQEVSLNDDERRRKGAAARRRLDDNARPDTPEEAAERRAKAQRNHALRQERQQVKADARAGVPSAPSAGAVQAQQSRIAERDAANEAARQDAPKAAAEARRERQARTKDAQEHRDAVRKRLAERGKPLAKPLPVPP